MKLLTLFAILLAIYFKTGITANTKQNFCQNNRCLTCIGRYCTTTCQGESCKNCPLGDCCDGSNCNICRGEKCCSTPECNTCVSSCLKRCEETSSCHYDCFQECLPDGRNGETQPNEIQGNRSPASSLISNKNYLPVNVTTIINITNTIQNENVIHNPILINTTNVNNYTGHNNYHRKHVLISTNKNNSRIITGENYTENITNGTDYPNADNGKNYTKQNCCEVIHPETCQEIKKQNEQLCYTRKHTECSSICIGKHVHIVEDKEQKSQCVTVAEEPYWYCGQYFVENCDICYNCTDADITNCTQSVDYCSEKCKSSLIAENFYNKLYRKE